MKERLWATLPTIALALSAAWFFYEATHLILTMAWQVEAQATGQNFADEETPGGIPDGARQFFTLRQLPVVASTKLYVNGQRLVRGADYAVYPTTKRIGFYPCCIPAAGDVLRIDYRY